MEIRDFKNVHEALRLTVDTCPDRAAYRWIRDDRTLGSVTWTEFYDQMVEVGKGLIALGVEPGDKVNILSYTSYRWILTDFAVMSIGSCTVGIYQTLLAKDCAYVANHSDAVVLFAEDRAQLAKMREVRDRVPNIRKVVLFKGDPGDDDWAMSFERFLALGKDVADADFAKRLEIATPSDPAGIVYTSGTTGVPKGAVLTHDNFTFTMQSARACLDVDDGDETLLFLPLAHVFARVIIFGALYAGATLVVARSLDTVADDMKIARPFWFASVPRIYEKVYSRIISGAEAKGGMALKIFRWAAKVGAEVSDHITHNRPIPAMTAAKYRVATKLVFSKVHEALGGRVRWCISGAAPLNPDIARFFHAAGVLILEGIGMTENTSFTNVNRVDNFRFGWVGPPGPGIEQMIGPDGEILYRGRNVMKEYYKMPEETAATISPEGWLHTGDLGEIDAENFLRVTGRKKDLIITAGGKNVAPTAIEGLIGTSKYVSQVCVVGDRRKYLSALVSLEQENIEDYAKEKGISFSSFDDLKKDPQIIALIESEVAEKNKELASFETIKQIRIVDEFTIENGLLTPTLKIKRNVALERYGELIDSMYPDED